MHSCRHPTGGYTIITGQSYSDSPLPNPCWLLSHVTSASGHGSAEASAERGTSGGHGQAWTGGAAGHKEQLQLQRPVSPLRPVNAAESARDTHGSSWRSGPSAPRGGHCSAGRGSRVRPPRGAPAPSPRPWAPRSPAAKVRSAAQPCQGRSRPGAQGSSKRSAAMSAGTRPGAAPLRAGQSPPRPRPASRDLGDLARPGRWGRGRGEISSRNPTPRAAKRGRGREGR